MVSSEGDLIWHGNYADLLDGEVKKKKAQCLLFRSGDSKCVAAFCECLRMKRSQNVMLQNC